MKNIYERRATSDEQRGIALAVVLVILTILVIIALSISSTGIVNLRNMRKYRDSAVAYYAARAGVAKAIDAIRTTPSYAWTEGFPDYQQLSDANAAYLVSFNDPNTAGKYDSTNNINGGAPSRKLVSEGGDGITVPEGCAYIVSTGVCYNKAGAVTATRRIGAMIKGPSGPYSTFPSYIPDYIPNSTDFNPLFLFKYAVFGNNGITKTGSASTNSYNSAVGTYPYTMNNSGGNIATNSTLSSYPQAIAIEITGSGTIYGTVYVGEGGNPSTAIRKVGSTTYLGTGALTETQPLPAVKDPVIGTGQTAVNYSSGGDHGALAPGKYGSFNISGGNLTLTSGNYSFTGTGTDPGFSVTGGSTSININAAQGPVNIFVNGEIKMQGGLTNSSYLAENFRLWGTSACTSVTLSGNTAAYYVLYAPNADINISGTADIFGAVVGKTTNLSGSGSINHDEALNSLSLEELTTTMGGTVIDGGSYSGGVGGGVPLEIVTWTNVY